MTPRVLIVLHGDEPAGWWLEACRIVSMWKSVRVRVLVIPNVPCPRFTSLTPFARRLYDGARRAWRREKEIRLQPALDFMMRALPRNVEIIRAPSSAENTVSTIVEAVDDWSADVVVVGAPAPGLRSWLSLGPVHERVLRRATCAVVVPWMPEVSVGSRRPRLLPAPFSRPRLVIAHREA